MAAACSSRPAQELEDLALLAAREPVARRNAAVRSDRLFQQRVDRRCRGRECFRRRKKALLVLALRILAHPGSNRIAELRTSAAFGLSRCGTTASVPTRSGMPARVVQSRNARSNSCDATSKAGVPIWRLQPFAVQRRHGGHGLGPDDQLGRRPTGGRLVAQREHLLRNECESKPLSIPPVIGISDCTTPMTGPGRIVCCDSCNAIERLQ